jgi:predicted nucleotidyltransferase
VTLESGIEIPVERIGEICRRYGVKEMAVFGSAARGDMRPDSDIDIMVELSADSRLGLDFFRMEEELSELFGRKVDLGTKRALKPRVRPFALQDARVIYAA